MALCTLDDAKIQLKASQAGTGAITATEEAKLLRAVYRVTRRVEQLTKIAFEPYRDTKYITAASDIVNSRYGILTLPEPLLEVVSLVNDGTTITESTDFYSYPRGRTPINQLRLVENSCYSWYPANCNLFDTLVITGVWGYKENYSRDGWISADALAANITDSATALTVADVDGLDAMNRTPRLSPGNLVKVNSEIMEVLGTNTSTNVFTARRGVRGTTAAAHTAGATVYTWNVQEDIRDTCARQAAAMYARLGAFESSVVSELGQVNYPPDLLQELLGTLQGYVLA